MPPPEPAPSATAAAPFSSRGQFVLTSGLGFFSTSDTSTTISFTPDIDYFVGGGFSLGGGIGYSRQSFSGNAQPTNSFWQINLRVGVNLAVADNLSFWPLISTSTFYPNGGQSSFVGELSLPLLIHIAPHFFLAGGPFVATTRPLGNDSAALPSHTSEGLLTFIGGWW